jgi:hypothetical protein
MMVGPKENVGGSELQQVSEPAQHLAELLALLGLEFAEKGFFKLGPIIGKAIADANASLGERNARYQFGAHGALIDKATIQKARQARREGVARQAQLIGKSLFRGAGTTQLEQHGIVAGLKPTLHQGHEESLVRQLAGCDEPVER